MRMLIYMVSFFLHYLLLMIETIVIFWSSFLFLKTVFVCVLRSPNFLFIYLIRIQDTIVFFLHTNEKGEKEEICLFLDLKMRSYI